jgi:hypothetical protein
MLDSFTTKQIGEEEPPMTTHAEGEEEPNTTTAVGEEEPDPWETFTKSPFGSF